MLFDYALCEEERHPLPEFLAHSAQSAERSSIPMCERPARQDVDDYRDQTPTHDVVSVAYQPTYESGRNYLIADRNCPKCTTHADPKCSWCFLISTCGMVHECKEDLQVELDYGARVRLYYHEDHHSDPHLHAHNCLACEELIRNANDDYDTIDHVTIESSSRSYDRPAPHLQLAPLQLAPALPPTPRELVPHIQPTPHQLPPLVSANACTAKAEEDTSIPPPPPLLELDLGVPPPPPESTWPDYRTYLLVHQALLAHAHSPSPTNSPEKCT